MRQIDHIDIAERPDGLCDVVRITKEYGHMGPDPGREVAREVVVPGLSREEAAITERLLKKEAYGQGWSVTQSVSRWISQWCDGNEWWAEKVENPIAY